MRLGPFLDKMIFKKSSIVRAASRDRFNSVYQDANPDEFYNDIWAPIARLFDGTRANAQTVESQF